MPLVRSRGRVLRAIGRTSVLLFVGLVLALASMRIQRRGPKQVAYGNPCGPTGDDLCYRPVLKGGFPVAFLLDVPGVSVEDQLAFGEDHFRAGAFWVDVALYWILALVAVRFIARPTSHRPGADGGEGSVPR